MSFQTHGSTNEAGYFLSHWFLKQHIHNAGSYWFNSELFAVQSPIKNLQPFLATLSTMAQQCSEPNHNILPTSSWRYQHADFKLVKCLTY